MSAACKSTNRSRPASGGLPLQQFCFRANPPQSAVENCADLRFKGGIRARGRRLAADESTALPRLRRADARAPVKQVNVAAKSTRPTYAKIVRWAAAARHPIARVI